MYITWGTQDQGDARGEVKKINDTIAAHTTIAGNYCHVFFDGSMWPRTVNAGDFENKGENEASSSLGFPHDTHTITKQQETSFGRGSKL